MRSPRTLLTLSLVCAGLAAPYAIAEDLPGIGRTTGEVLPRLQKGLNLVDEQHTLPESSWIGSDKASKQEDINELLDEALDALEIEAVKSYRKDIQRSKKQIRKAQERIAEYRQKRLSAPEEGTFGLNKLPFFTTRAGYDQKIEVEKQIVKDEQQLIDSTKKAFREHLAGIGLDVSAEDFDLLLTTVNGDDYLDLKLLFDQVKVLTQQLEKLTEESGEDVRNAKRYFGMYTVLLRVLDRAQKKFVTDIDKVHTPKIGEYETKAKQNIVEAEEAIERGGDRAILERNIKSNNLTIDALNLYRDYLARQRSNVLTLNQMLQKDMLAADNTYKTVNLAAEVVSLLRTGIRNYELLLKLEPPDLKGFENKELRGEIRKLTELMRE